MAAVEGRHAHYARALGAETCAAVAGARVLVVGAGGIGCELLKNLVLAGFRAVEVVDLDTIDVSNLNRQFLFRARHVGLAKAEVACGAAAELDGGARLRPHHADAREARFGPAFVASFALVFMALDNVAARRHVNRLCLAAGVPLLESGTAGFLGQVQVIRRGLSECYDCREKPRPKTFPYCTIHNTPSRPEHCVIWAKAKFADAFSAAAARATDAAEAEAEAEAAEVATDAALAAEEAALAALAAEDWPRALYRRLYHRDLLERRLLAALRPPPAGGGPPPRPPPLPRLPPSPAALAAAEAEERARARERKREGKAAAALLDEQRVWGPAESARVFLEASAALRARAAAVEWDKDDEAALDWVAAAANLRADLFGIAPQSRFDCKAMAGSIIPAIATTNAVVAGLLVLEALRLLAGRGEQCRYTYLLQRPSGKKVLLDLPLPKPSPDCFVCQASVLQVRVDTAEALGAFVAEVLQGRLGLLQPALYVGASGIYECGADLEEEERAHLAALALRPMRDLRLGDGALLRVEDDAQELSFDILISHADGEREEGGPWFELIGKDAVLLKPKEADAAAEEPQAEAQAEEDGDAAMADAEADDGARGTKRKAGASDEEPSSKRKR